MVTQGRWTTMMTMRWICNETRTLLSYESESRWIHLLAISHRQKRSSSINYTRCHVNTKRTPDPKSQSSDANHMLITRLSHICNLSLTSHTDPIAGTESMSLSQDIQIHFEQGYHAEVGQKEFYVEWGPKCHQRRAPRGLMRPKNMQCLRYSGVPRKGGHDT
jgi:hypothetical protein